MLTVIVAKILGILPSFGRLSAAFEPAQPKTQSCSETSIFNLFSFEHAAASQTERQFNRLELVR